MDAPSPEALITRGPMPGGRPGAAPLLAGIRWLVLLRWAAIAGIIAAWQGAVWLDVVSPSPAVFAVAAALAALNLLVRWAVRGPGTRRRRARRLLEAQIAADYAALIVLLHLSGGVENPFASFMLVHAALAGILLPNTRGLLLAVLGTALYSGVVVAEAQGALTHHHLRLTGGPCEAGLGATLLHAGALGAAMLVTLYLVQTVRARQESSERQRLEQERLARSREPLARIGEFSAGVAHTVRNPLHGALNCVALLESGPAGAADDSRRALAWLREALESIRRVTERMLSLTRERPMVLRPTPVAELIADALSLVSSRLAEKGLTPAVEATAGTFPLDADRLLETLVILLDNAAYASPPGGTIRVIAHRVPYPPESSGARWGPLAATAAPGERGLLLEVRDQGPGIPPEVLRRVFDPFYTTKPIGEGTGIGLSIAQRAVEEHGGEIALDAPASGGTAARILLPYPAED